MLNWVAHEPGVVVVVVMGRQAMGGRPGCSTHARSSGYIHSPLILSIILGLIMSLIFIKDYFFFIL